MNCNSWSFIRLVRTAKLQILITRKCSMFIIKNSKFLMIVELEADIFSPHYVVLCCTVMLEHQNMFCTWSWSDVHLKLPPHPQQTNQLQIMMSLFFAYLLEPKLSFFVTETIQITNLLWTFQQTMKCCFIHRSLASIIISHQVLKEDILKVTAISS